MKKKSKAKKIILILLAVIVGGFLLWVVGYLLYLLFAVVIPMIPGLVYAFFK